MILQAGTQGPSSLSLSLSLAKTLTPKLKKRCNLRHKLLRPLAQWGRRVAAAADCQTIGVDGTPRLTQLKEAAHQELQEPIQ